MRNSVQHLMKLAINQNALPGRLNIHSRIINIIIKVKKTRNMHKQ